VNAKPDLLEVVATAHSASCFASGLDRWQQQANQHSNDRDHDQQLNEREAPAGWIFSEHGKPHLEH
jgi:hypothetical protein